MQEAANRAALWQGLAQGRLDMWPATTRRSTTSSSTCQRLTGVVRQTWLRGRPVDVEVAGGTMLDAT